MKKPRFPSKAPVIHDSMLAFKIQNWLEYNGSLKNAFTDADNLSIFTAHNLTKKTILERNLDFLGLKNYHVIHIRVPEWNHTIRLRHFLSYLENDCHTEYVLYLDATDVVLVNSPEYILNSFLSLNVSALYNSTRWGHGYQCMPDMLKWAESVHPGRYLNGGAFIGKRSFIILILRECLKYVTDNPPTSKYFYDHELEFKDNFPHGIGCDQPILRFLERDFFPDLMVDAENKIFYRNHNLTNFDATILKFKKSIYKALNFK